MCGCAELPWLAGSEGVVEGVWWERKGREGEKRTTMVAHKLGRAIQYMASLFPSVNTRSISQNIQ